MTCLWCGGPFRARTSGGSKQCFCAPSCRHAYGSALRRWAAREVEEGRLSLPTLKAAVTSARAVGATYKEDDVPSPESCHDQTDGKRG